MDFSTSSRIAPDSCEFSIYTNDSTVEAITKAFQKYITHSKYIWHVEQPILTQTAQNTLCGSFRFGEGVLDEWFLTKCLADLSRQFPDVRCTAFDADGDFWLIEAAEFIPDWLEPENSANRFFLADGKLCFLDPKSYPKVDSVETMLGMSWNINPLSKIHASSSVQGALSSKMDEAMKFNARHVAALEVSYNIAKVLTILPQRYLGELIDMYTSAPKEEIEEIGKSLADDAPRSDSEYCHMTVPLSRLQFAQLAFAYSEVPSDQGISRSLGRKLSVALLMEYYLTEETDLQREIKRIINSPEAFDNNRHQYEMEDSLDWINEDAMPDMNYDDEEKEGLSMNDQEDILKEWMREEEQLQREADEISDEESEEEENETEMQDEILKAIRNDPDLLMKIIGRFENEQEDGLDESRSAELSDLMKKLGQVQIEETSLKEGTMEDFMQFLSSKEPSLPRTAAGHTQQSKGLGDLSEASITELRDYLDNLQSRLENIKGNSNEPAGDDDGESDASSDPELDDVDMFYDPGTYKQVRDELGKNTPVVDSDED